MKSVRVTLGVEWHQQCQPGGRQPFQRNSDSQGGVGAAQRPRLTGARAQPVVVPWLCPMSGSPSPSPSPPPLRARLQAKVHDSGPDEVVRELSQSSRLWIKPFSPTGRRLSVTTPTPPNPPAAGAPDPLEADIDLPSASRPDRKRRQRGPTIEVSAEPARVGGIALEILPGKPTDAAQKKGKKKAARAKRNVRRALVEIEALGELSLDQLKECAATEGMDPGWQDIGPEHKKELRVALATRNAELQTFASSVHAATKGGAHRDAALIELGMSRGTRGKRQKKQKVLEEDAGPWKPEIVDRMLAAAVHLIPSGSGVVVTPTGVVLTCAHAVAADEDPDEDDDAPQPSRLGRIKTLITASGELLLAKCVAVDEPTDAAALQIIWSSVTGEHDGPLNLDMARVAPLAPGPPLADPALPIACVGNPYDWDLEREAGSRPRRSGFTPFHTSLGEITAVRVDVDPDCCLGG